MHRLNLLWGCTGFDGTGKVRIARGRVGCLKDAKKINAKTEKTASAPALAFAA